MTKFTFPTKQDLRDLLGDKETKKVLRNGGLFLLFLVLTLACFFTLKAGHAPDASSGGSATYAQYVLFTLGGAVLLAGLATWTVAAATGTKPVDQRPVWHAPLLAGGLGLALMILGYFFIGVWPVGDKTVLTVDMHHQYAPLLSELRHMLLNGGDFTYNFNVGMGAAFIPTFAYYLASPLNILLLFFSEKYLAQAILLITLLKIGAAAASFTAMAQYLYRRRDAGMVAVGVLYALCGYMLAYSWNIMWLDVVALMPAVVLAMEHMLRTGKITPYAVLLALALFCNYYIGFMLCVFLVLYMLVWAARKHRSGMDLLYGGVRFAAGSLWGAGMAAALLIPTALALGRTSAAGGEVGEFATNFPLFDLLGRLFYGATPTIRSGNLPNLYCGIPAVLLAPLYFCQKQIPLRRRLCFGGLLVAMLFSCTLTQVDLVWHGLHAPNDLPYRFSFIVCFVLLLMAGHVLSRLERVTPRQVLGSLLGSAAYLFLWEKLGALTTAAEGAEAAEKVTTSEALLYGNLLLLAVYAAVLLVAALKKAPNRVVSRMLLTVVCAEMLLSTSTTLTAINQNEYFTRHQDYIAHLKHEALDTALRRAEELAAQEADTAGKFLRMEYLPRTTCVDTALHHYSGLTTFASSNPYLTTKFMGEMGYAVNGVNSYLYHSYVAPIDSLLGLRYVVLENDLAAHPQLEQVDSVTVEDDQGHTETRYIYRNRLALSVGMAVNSTVKDYQGTKYQPFQNQQDLYESLTGLADQIYVPMTLSTDTEGATVTGAHFYMPDTGAVYTATVTERAQYFAYVDCRAAEDISVEHYREDGSQANYWSVSHNEPYIVDLGTLSGGDTVQVSVSGEGAASGNIHVVRLDTDALAAHLEVLQAGNLLVTQQKGSTLSGTVTAQEEQSLFFSIPYDKGWQVYVDGVAVETFPIATDREETTDEEGNVTVEGGDDGALLGAAIPAGTHDVKLVYTAPGQVLGAMTSVACLLLLSLPALKAYVRRKKRVAIPAPAPAAATEELPPEQVQTTLLPDSALPDDPDFQCETGE